MEKLNQWPPALLRRWLLQAAAGLGCLLVSAVMFLSAGDKVLLMLGVMVAMSIAVRCTVLYRIITKDGFETVEGVCIRIKNTPLRKQRCVSFLTEAGVEQEILLDKQSRVQIGNCYRLYFRQTSQTCFAQDMFLAMEDQGEYQAELEASGTIDVADKGNS